jgi:hypothetical protein
MRRVSGFQDDNGIADPSLNVEGFRPKFMPLDLDCSKRVLYELPQGEMSVNISSGGAEAVPYMFKFISSVIAHYRLERLAAGRA